MRAISVPLSVVIVWREIREGLAECLAGLVDQVRSERGEILVATDRPEAEVAGTLDRFPGVRRVQVDEPLTEPRAWRAGVDAARGETVAFGQARGRYAPGWARAVLARGATGDRVVAGPVCLKEGTSIGGRAAFLCDYAPFADPDGPDPGGAASVNVAFGRRALAEEAGPGLHKWALLASGRFRAVWEPGMRVALDAVGPAGVARFHRGRHYAALRAAGWPAAGRLAAGLGCVALPWLLAARLARVPHVRRRHLGTLALGSPWVAASLGLWSLGEMAGYWTGPGRASRFL
jgi:hypothetical protein